MINKTYFFKLVFEPPLLLLQLDVELPLVVVPLLDLRVVEVVVAGLQLEHVALHLGNTGTSETVTNWISSLSCPTILHFDRITFKKT